jgi:hypothetical protein
VNLSLSSRLGFLVYVLLERDLDLAASALGLAVNFLIQNFRLLSYLLIQILFYQESFASTQIALLL